MIVLESYKFVFKIQKQNASTNLFIYFIYLCLFYKHCWLPETVKRFTLVFECTLEHHGKVQVFILIIIIVFNLNCVLFAFPHYYLSRSWFLYWSSWINGLRSFTLLFIFIFIKCFIYNLLFSMLRFEILSLKLYALLPSFERFIIPSL